MGSEMCIRDSRRVDNPVKLRAFLRHNLLRICLFYFNTDRASRLTIVCVFCFFGGAFFLEALSACFEPDRATRGRFTPHHTTHTTLEPNSTALLSCLLSTLPLPLLLYRCAFIGMWLFEADQALVLRVKSICSALLAQRWLAM